MLNQVYESNNRQFSLFIKIKTTGEKRFKVIAEDYGKVNSEYANRIVAVSGEKQIFLSFPISPKRLGIQIYNLENSKDTDFEVSFQENPLRTYNIWIDAKTNEFLPLATYFSQVCGFEQASDQGRVFKTQDGQFVIKYYNKIYDKRTKKIYNTPARIGHNSGIIDTAKWKFDGYTFAMRMIILLHEYSHKYKNPNLGLDISNEIGADINALYIYLGLGFSKIDAICVFANVFFKAQTPGNRERMRKIMDYIQKFEAGEFAKPNYVIEDV